MALKFNVLAENLRGKRVVMIDDSIVRGNTTGPLVKLLRDAGAREVHLRVTCPPIAHPCFMGVDMGTYDELIAHRLTLEEMRDHIRLRLAALPVAGRHDARHRADRGLLQRLLHRGLPAHLDVRPDQDRL